MFRNLTIFRFPPTAIPPGMLEPVERNEGASFSIDPPFIEQSLRDCALRPVGPLELSSRGFVSPYGRDHAMLTQRVGDVIAISVGGEDKILPGSVVNEALAKKLAEIEQREGRKPGGRTRKRLKEEIVTDLLPRALVKPSRVDAYLDLSLNLLVVDTASRKQAESVASEIRRALGSFPAMPLNAEVAPRAVLTDWVLGAAQSLDLGARTPDGLFLGDSATLKDPADKGATVRVTGQDLGADEIGEHYKAGKQVTRLALTYEDRVSFTLDEDLVIRKFKLLDGATDQLESTERDDLAAELDARLALLSGEVRRLFVVLEKALRLSKAEA